MIALRYETTLIRIWRIDKQFDEIVSLVEEEM